MNKKLLLAGIVAVVGFVTLTAFGGKTLEQQKAEIQTAITAKLEEFRATKQEECNTRVTTEAQNRFTQWQAEEEAKAAATPGKKSSTPKNKPASKPSTQPLPQPQPPAPTNPKSDKMQGGTNTSEKQDKMQGQPNTSDKKKKMQGGGN
ncbi:MAG: hypothetical protein JNL02_07640 [Saprospiraceae bacterium]|nr:hypothetical protein [Saprospiraceae bacterium]MCC7504689.1 hypothetical protein [Saprospiraceae bacterium]